ncbi:hypothetical protein GW933_04090 [Candidatus Falkowbacteria bacterium]|uniref:Uncharacterized protein n=1 Tax=Candidatus Buchananbacteria bacterium CG10_big_fil_rev_8_21_14_0_10_33_19 TaxID=1974525 RepID=A0A2H0W7B4_9BACT|nr:hypothetical protein [Candidatus Falkowbacteria bacterium]PIS06481.1 MAG: hypothetical protein COT80_00905 [Candidatus Buchananbacteria bacterium CG10_big_fil_rev_8_21_14_0_10_33_19]
MNEITTKINQANNILIVSHRRPDSDAIGSSLAMFFYLQSLGKNPKVFNIGPVPIYFDFLPGIEIVCSSENILNNQFDLVIALDLAGLDHAGIDDKFFKNNYVINIDHHISNTNFGNINFINSQASSTCEIIYTFLNQVEFNIDKNIANCLLCGILDDTGNFSNSATNIISIKAAAELISKGAKIYKIDDIINKNKSIGGLHLWGKVLSRMKSDASGEIVYAYIKEDEYREYNIAEEELDGLTNFLNVICDVKLVALFRIGPDYTRVSMRTNRDDVDLSLIAQRNGGGGHKKAAGFSIDNTLSETSDLLSFLKKDD